MQVFSKHFVAAAFAVVTLAASFVAASPAAASRPGDAGRFDTWTGYSVGRFPIDVVAADLNGDGLGDAAWLRDEFYEPTFTVQLNLGDGTLGPATTQEVTEQPNDIKGGDLDGDGDLDLVVASDGNSLNNTTVDVYINDGSGDFTRSSVPGGIGPEALALADVDGNGTLDIALASDGYDDDAGTVVDYVSILPGAGDGTFGPEVAVPVGLGLHGIDAADLDGDGDQDLVVVRDWYEETGARLAVLENVGAPGTVEFAAQPEVELGYLAWPIVAAGDLTTDPLAELVVAGLGERHLVFRNDGGLNFTEFTATGGYTSMGLVLADVDSDSTPVGGPGATSE